MMSTLTIKDQQKMPAEIKKSVAIILIGNFLEFFDLLLAVHMTLVLTKVFLPPDSSFTPLMSTFTFCSSFCIRPLAAFFWGYIGDSIGRVPVLISTTFLMSISCILIPNIPPYAEWGMASAILFLLMRLVQGFASGGECIAADVFISETVAKPKVYFCSALVEATCSLGGLVACGLGVICLKFSPENGWKIPFYIGSGVAVLGTIARKTLKETPEFVKTLQKNAERRKLRDIYSTISLKNKNVLSLFCMYLFPAVAFYFTLAFIPSMLESEFGLSTDRVMMQTTVVLIITMCAEIFYGYLGLKFHPFKILKTKLYTLMALLPFLSVIFVGYRNPITLFFVQSAVSFLGQGLTPATPIINRSFPIASRYTYLLVIWAVSHSMLYLLTGYVCEAITNFHILSLMLFICAGISLTGSIMFNPDQKSVLDPNEEVEGNDGQKKNQGSAKYKSRNQDLDFYEKDKKILIKSWLKKNLT